MFSTSLPPLCYPPHCLVSLLYSIHLQLARPSYQHVCTALIMYFYYGVSHFIKSKSFRKLGNYIFFIQMTQFFTCMVNGIVVTYADSMSSRFWFFYLIGT
eukprot:UN07249